MSNEAINWAIEQELPAMQKYVLFVLANRAHPRTGCCNPSLTRLEQDTGLTRRAITKILTKLEEAGMIAREKRHPDATVYRVGRVPGSLEQGPIDPTVGSYVPQGRVPDDIQVGSHVYPNPKKNPYTGEEEERDGCETPHDEPHHYVPEPIIGYGEFGWARMTEAQHRKLQGRIGDELADYIERFDDWVNQGPDKKDKGGIQRRDRHAYETIRNWHSTALKSNGGPYGRQKTKQDRTIDAKNRLRARLDRENQFGGERGVERADPGRLFRIPDEIDR